MTKTLIGRCAVDSGQGMIGDPCYLEDWKAWDKDVDKFEDHVNKVGEYGYLGACNATITKGYGELKGATAVVFDTGYGRSFYPVYADINEDGSITRIIIELITDDDEN